MKRRFAHAQRTHQQKTFRLRVEALESRRVLATAVWDGGGDDGRWMNAENWVGDDAPSPGDDLWFVGAAARKTNSNNFPTGTNFASINFAAGGYTISGTRIDLTGGITALNASGNNTLNLPVTLTGPDTITSTHAATNLVLKSSLSLEGTLTVAGTGNTSLEGVVRGPAGIVKNGPGTLSLAGDNTYTGTTTINAGVVSVFGFGNPLGNESVGTVVKNGATLQTTHINDNMAEPLTLSGFGVFGNVLGSVRGALEIGPPAFTTWTGPITLVGDASIGVNHTGNFTVSNSPIKLNGHTLTINGMGPTLITSPIIDGSASGSLAINTALVSGTDYGVVTSTAVNTYTGSTLINSGVLSLSGNGSLASTDIQVMGAPGTPPFGSNGFPLAGGVLRLDNTNSLKTNRIADNAVVTFEGGALQYLGLNGPSLSTETIGRLNFAAGQSYVQSIMGEDANASNRLTIGSLSRAVGATVDFSGVGLGTSDNRLLFTQAPTKVGSNGGILPYATYTGETDQNFATYTAALGIAPFTGYVTSLASAGATDIVLLTSSQTLSANKSVLGLLVRDGGSNTTVTLSSGVTLNVSRALLTTSTANSSNTVTIAPPAGNSAQLTFGSEGILHRNAPTVMKAAIGGNTTLTLSGLAPLAFEPPTGGNTYTGGTILNSGEFTLNNENSPLGDADAPLELRGGVLGEAVPFTQTIIPNPLVLDDSYAHFKAISDISFTGPISLSGRNIVAVPGNVTVDFAGQVSGAGSLVVTAAHNSGAGGGTLILSNAGNNYSGGTTLVNSGIFDTTLQLNGPNVLGSGPVRLSGGNLTAGAPLTLTRNLSLASSTLTFGGTSPIKLAGDITLVGINNLGRDFSGGPPVTISGTIRGSGAITKTGNHYLTLTGDNTYSGSTLITEGTLVVRGIQPSSPVGVVKTGSVLARLSGIGTVGFISAASNGIVDPGTTSTFGRLTAPGANFSDGGVLRLRIGNDAATGTDFDSLNLGSGRLIVGPRSPLQFDLSGLESPRSVENVVRYGSRLGVTNRFTPVSTINNPDGFTVTPTYTSTALNVAIQGSSGGSTSSQSQLASDAVFSELGDEYDSNGRTRRKTS